MGNKNKKGNNIRIMTDKPRHVEYTFIDDGSFKFNTSSDTDLSRESKRKEKKISFILLEDIQILLIVYDINPTNQQKPNLSKTILLFMNSDRYESIND